MNEASYYDNLGPYLTAKDIQRILKIGKTQSYKVMRDIEENYPNEMPVLRFESQLRVKTNVFMEWVEAHSGREGYGNKMTTFVANLYRVA